MLVLRAQITRVVLGAGNFDWQATRLTANTLGVFALSIFAQGLTPLFSRAFYARQNTKIPVVIGLISMVLNFILSYFLSRHFGVLGLASGFTIASIFNAWVLYIVMRRHIKHLDDKYLLYSVLKILLSTVLMAIAAYVALYYLGLLLPLDTGLHVLIQGFVAGMVGIAVFVGLSGWLALDQTTLVWTFLKNKVWNKMLFREKVE